MRSSCVDEVEVHRAHRAGRIDRESARLACRRRDLAREPLGEKILQRFDLVPLDRKPRRGRVPAAVDQQALGFRRRDRRAEIDAGRRAPGAFRRFVFADAAEHDGRLHQSIFQPPGRDADDAGMPAVRADDDDAARFCFRNGRGFRFGQHLRFALHGVRVERFERRREFARFGGIFG